ncbi:MAG: DUF1097 domain-containing protein [Peptococcaceae bacterium]
MDFLIAVGISVGILAGLWTAGSVSFGLLTFAGFLSWASFYAAGGKIQGLKNTLITNFSGVIWGFIMIKLSVILTPLLGDIAGLGLAVMIGAGGMCWQAKIPLLGFIPGAFIGCSTFFAANFDFAGSVTGLILGAFLGYISEIGGLSLAKKEPLPEDIKA